MVVTENISMLALQFWQRLRSQLPNFMVFLTIFLPSSSLLSSHQRIPLHPTATTWVRHLHRLMATLTYNPEVKEPGDVRAASSLLHREILSTCHVTPVHQVSHINKHILNSIMRRNWSIFPSVCLSFFLCCWTFGNCTAPPFHNHAVQLAPSLRTSNLIFTSITLPLKNVVSKLIDSWLTWIIYD